MNYESLQRKFKDLEKQNAALEKETQQTKNTLQKELELRLGEAGTKKESEIKEIRKRME